MGKNSQRKLERDRQRLLDFNSRRGLAQAVDLNLSTSVMTIKQCKGVVVSVGSDTKTDSIHDFVCSGSPAAAT